MGEVRVNKFGGAMGIQKYVTSFDVALIAVIFLEIPETFGEIEQHGGNDLLPIVFLRRRFRTCF